MSIWPSSPCPSAKANFTCLKPENTHFEGSAPSCNIIGRNAKSFWPQCWRWEKVDQAAGSQVWGPRRLKPQALSLSLSLPCNPRSLKCPVTPELAPAAPWPHMSPPSIPLCPLPTPAT